jgi:sugar O-acyltransferase (sialic acid O-acetyltransferase NeuD family)
MVDVVIYGAGGLGRMVLDILRHGRRSRAVAFLDSNPVLRGQIVDGLPVAGGLECVRELLRAGTRGAIVAIGDNYARVAIAEELQGRGLRLVSAIHPLVSISPTARLAEHLIVGPRVNICVHARIGPHSVLLPGAIIEHDNVIGRGVFLYPAVRLAGTVMVGDFATLDIGACVIPGRRIGRGAHIEPGAVVIHDVASGSTVGGVPATPRPAPSPPFDPAARAVRPEFVGETAGV